MKHNLKLITLLSLGAFSMTAFAQSPNVSVNTNAAAPTVVTTSGTKVVINQDVPSTTNVGEGNAFEQSVTPLLRQISRLKSDLEIKKLQKEIEKLDAVEKKEATGFVPMPTPQTAMQTTVPTPQKVEENVNPVRVLMTYGAEDDLYAKIAIGVQGGYTVRKGDILPDGRLVLAVKPNYVEVEKSSLSKIKSKKSNSEKIFVSTGLTLKEMAAQTQGGQGNSGGTTTNTTNNFLPMPTANVPSAMPMPAMNSSTSVSR